MPTTNPASAATIASLEPEFLARLPYSAGPDLSRMPTKLDEMEARLRQVSAAGLCRRGAPAESPSGPGRRGQGFRAARRRLRRKLLRLHRQRHSRHLPRAAADGGGADLRRVACRW